MTRIAVPHLLLPDPGAVADLSTYLGRAARVDPGGAARLVAHGRVLAVYASPIHGGGAPTVLGLRTTALAEPSDLDLTVALAALTDRIARLSAPATGALHEDAPVALPIPSVAAAGIAWAGMSPPRGGWVAGAIVATGVLSAAASSGVAEVAAASPAGAGALAVARVRALVWGRPLTPELDGVPAGVAFAADALGFLDADEPATLHRAGAWTRVTTARGHVLARMPSLL